MKKLLVGLLVLMSLAFMGCSMNSDYPVKGYFRVYNKSDTSYYVMLDYNKSMDGESKASLISAKTYLLTTSCDGKYTQSKIDKQGDDIVLYYCSEDEWVNLKKNEYDGYTDYWIMTQSGETCIKKEIISGYKSKYYKLKIFNDQITVETTWDE